MWEYGKKEDFFAKDTSCTGREGCGLLIALLNLSVLGFSFVFHDKAKRTQQVDLLDLYGLKYMAI